MDSLVVAWFNENLDWLNSINKNININIIDKKLQNIGRESHAYFKFIVENYDKLEGSYTFCQGNPFPHCSDIINKINQGTSLPFYALADNYITNNINGQPNHHSPLKGQEIVDELNIKVPPSIYFPTGGQFIIKAELIKQYPLEFYKKCLEIHHKYYDAPWVFERIWHIIFDFSNNSDITYYALGLGIGDALASLTTIYHMTKDSKNFGVILLPNQDFFTTDELEELCRINLPNLTNVIKLTQDAYKHLVKFYWPSFAFCRPRAWERITEEISFLSGIKKTNIWPTFPREDCFASNMKVKHSSKFKAPVQDYILYNPISLQSMTMEQLYPNWTGVLNELSKCKYPIILIAKDYIDVDLPNIINLSGKTTLFDTYSLADNAKLVVTTANNLCFYCHYNNIPHFVISNKILDNNNLFFRKWLRNDNDKILFTHDSINILKLKLSKTIKEYQLGRIFNEQCPHCHIWE